MHAAPPVPTPPLTTPPPTPLLISAPTTSTTPAPTPPPTACVSASNKVQEFTQGNSTCNPAVCYTNCKDPCYETHKCYVVTGAQTVAAKTFGTAIVNAAGLGPMNSSIDDFAFTFNIKPTNSTFLSTTHNCVLHYDPPGSRHELLVCFQSGKLRVYNLMTSSTGAPGRMTALSPTPMVMGRWTEIALHFSIHTGWHLYFDRARMETTGVDASSESLELNADGASPKNRSATTFNPGFLRTDRLTSIRGGPCTAKSDVEVNDFRFLTKEEWEENKAFLTTFNSTEQVTEELTESSCLGPRLSYLMTDPCSRSGRCMLTPVREAILCDTIDPASGNPAISVCTKAAAVAGGYGKVSPNCTDGWNIPIMVLHKVVMCSKTGNSTACTVTKKGRCMVPKTGKAQKLLKFLSTLQPPARSLMYWMRYGRDGSKLAVLSEYFSDPSDFTTCGQFTGTECSGKPTPNGVTMSVENARVAWEASLSRFIKAA